MPGMGPPPKPAGTRRRTNPTVAMTKLPAEGRNGPPPAWPLPPDVRRQAQLARYGEQIEDLSMDAQGTGREAAAARRKLLTLQERADILAAELEASAEQEKILWESLWSTPQAVAWERLRWTREVALYVRWSVAAELGDMDAAKEARQWSDRLGLNSLALLRLRWEIAADEVDEQRTTRTRRTANSTRARRGLKAVDGTG
jgi:hypothetical protein